MPQRLSQQAAECHLNAERCMRNALAASDATARREFLEMEQRWRMLADCYDSSRGLARSTAGATAGSTRGKVVQNVQVAEAMTTR